jgi:hypothetical protein
MIDFLIVEALIISVFFAATGPTETLTAFVTGLGLRGEGTWCCSAPSASRLASCATASRL